MKKILFILLGIFLSTKHTLASGWDSGVLQGLSVEKIKNGDIHTDDIPVVILGATDFLMGIAGTIAIIFIIIGAYQMAIGSATENSTAEWKKTIILALAGFILASISWIIFKILIDNFA